MKRCVLSLERNIGREDELRVSGGSDCLTTRGSRLPPGHLSCEIHEKGRTDRLECLSQGAQLGRFGDRQADFFKVSVDDIQLYNIHYSFYKL